MSILSLSTPVAAPKARVSALTRLAAFLAVARQRAALRRLDDAALSDIGISRAEAAREAARAPWDVPANWRL
jgi:uncharacterized protein YjiS (DUF1127 family)